MLSLFENGTCDGCEFHVVHYDEIDGKIYHDGCGCTHKEAKKADFHFKCCDSKENCPYKKINNKSNLKE